MKINPLIGVRTPLEFALYNSLFNVTNIPQGYWIVPTSTNKHLFPIVIEFNLRYTCTTRHLNIIEDPSKVSLISKIYSFIICPHCYQVGITRWIIKRTDRWVDTVFVAQFYFYSRWIILWFVNIKHFQDSSIVTCNQSVGRRDSSHTYRGYHFLYLVSTEELGFYFNRRQVP